MADNSKQVKIHPQMQMTAYFTTNPNEIALVNAHQTQQTHRVYQPLGLYIMVAVCDILSICLGLLLVVIHDREHVYLSYIILTCVRCVCWFINSWYLTGWSWDLVKLHVLLDNNMLFQMGTVATYTFINYNVQVNYALPAVCLYPVLILFLVGNSRVCLKYCLWSRWRVVVYKSIKLFGSMWFLCYGAYMTINAQIANRQAFLLWVFTTSGLYGELYFAANGLDQSDKLCTDYLIVDEHPHTK